MQKDFLNPEGLPDWRETFSQVVVVQADSMRTIYISGQVSVNADNKIVGHNDLGQQAETALENLRKALSATDATPDDVVRLGIYIKDYQREQAPVIGNALRRLFRPGKMPASTWLGVSSLALDDLLIEIEAIAVTESHQNIFQVAISSDVVSD